MQGSVEEEWISTFGCDFGNRSMEIEEKQCIPDIRQIFDCNFGNQRRWGHPRANKAKWELKLKKLWQTSSCGFANQRCRGQWKVKVGKTSVEDLVAEANVVNFK